MKLVAPNLAALLLCSVAAASPDAEFKLVSRAKQFPAHNFANVVLNTSFRERSPWLHTSRARTRP